MSVKMSEHPFHALFRTFSKVSNAIQTQLYNLIAQPHKPSPTAQKSLLSASSSSSSSSRVMSILSRMYPCKECADHFQEILRSNPVQAGSHAEFSQWLCHVHNTVNRSINKPIFPCERVDARWGKLECEQRACDLLGITGSFGDNTYY
ncbi:hypothetical protein C1H46_016179 [Malus baccata]|uniref:Sulfhydryl oxidase n=1 Tax=Malus baccata TaxID=106549 RepID=A0A540MHI8_MALBA|nr:hypothetical protein C1H46_016179 [Malus baccata]